VGEEAAMKRETLGVKLARAALVATVAAGVVAGASAAPRGTQAAGVPAGEAVLGTIHLGRRVLADGKPLPAGTYRVRLTAQTAQPTARGASPDLERWVEFLQGGQVKGREVATIVPKDEVAQVAKGRPPAAGAARVELLKGGEYVRVWINRGGTHYLIHLPVGAP
jgi:hypothetical protein